MVHLSCLNPFVFICFVFIAKEAYVIKVGIKILLKRILTYKIPIHHKF